jgi:hypothetical protein
MGALLGYVMAESCGQLLAVVGKELRIVRPARDRDVGHAAVEQVFRGQLGIDVNQDALGCLSLAGMARHRVAMIEMGMLCGCLCLVSPRNRVPQVSILRPGKLQHRPSRSSADRRAPPVPRTSTPRHEPKPVRLCEDFNMKRQPLLRLVVACGMGMLSIAESLNPNFLRTSSPSWNLLIHLFIALFGAAWLIQATFIHKQIKVQKG